MKRDVPILIRSDVRDALRDAKREGESYNELFIRLLRNSSGDGEAISPQPDDPLFEIREQIQALQKAVSDLQINATSITTTSNTDTNTTSNSNTDPRTPVSPQSSDATSEQEHVKPDPKVSDNEEKIPVTDDMIKQLTAIIKAGIEKEEMQKKFQEVVGISNRSVITSFIIPSQKPLKTMRESDYDKILSYAHENFPELLPHQ